VIFRILGELVIEADGPPVPLPSGYALRVLVGLLLNANRQVSIAELIEAAEGDRRVSSAQLHSAVHAVRRLLAKVGREDSLRTQRRVGYRLELQADDLDSLQFTSLVQEAEEIGMARRYEDEIALLWRAIGLWRGQHPASNAPGHGWPDSADALIQRRRRAATRLFQLEMSRGNYAKILGGLELMTRYHPADGPLHRERMISLYRSGSAAETVGVFDEYREAVRLLTGRLPDRADHVLAYAISNRDDEVVAATEARITGRDTRAGEELGRVPKQVPKAPARFIGRTNLVEELHWLLNQRTPPTTPVLLISGPAGIGKTALMRHAAHAAAKNYPDGQLHVELRGTVGPAADLDEVLAGFLRAFGVSLVPETTAERLATYLTLTADRRILILLDDAASGDQIRELIPANPHCAVMVTSRRRLSGLDGAHPVAPLTALPLPVAIEMFESLVTRSSLVARGDTGAIERLVSLCVGLPLAIRIVATLRDRDTVRSTDELARRLAQQGFEGFADGQDVGRAIGASFDSLSPDAKQLFLRLGLCRLPEFGFWTAAALLAGTDLDPADALSSLAEYSMVDSVESPEPMASSPRYNFHDLTQEYAYHRALEEYPEDERLVLVRQVSTALLGLLRYVHRSLCGGDFEVVDSDIPTWDAPHEVLGDIDEAPLAWFRRERLNIRTAVEQCAGLGLTQLCWDLAFSTHECYTLEGYFKDWLETHTTALRACRSSGDRRGEAVILVGLGQPALVASRPSGSLATLADLQHAIDLLVEAEDNHGLAIAKRTLANALRRQGQLARPLALFEEALAHYESSSDVLGRWQTLRYIGHTHLDRNDPHQALVLLERALEVATTEVMTERSIAQTKYWMGQAYLALDDLEAAQAAFSAVLDMFPEPVGSGHAYAMHGLGDVARREGELDRAADHLALAVRLAHEAADGTLEGRAAISLAGLRLALNDPAGEIAKLEHAARCFAAADAIYQQMATLVVLSRAHARFGNDSAATGVRRHARQLYAAMNLPPEDRIHPFRQEP
jgi:tetratricopeptide (TPR) repeat protein/DNA-binding SARP family transcriptional activator